MQDGGMKYATPNRPLFTLTGMPGKIRSRDPIPVRHILKNRNCRNLLKTNDGAHSGSQQIPGSRLITFSTFRQFPHEALPQ